MLPEKAELGVGQSASSKSNKARASDRAHEVSLKECIEGGWRSLSLAALELTPPTIRNEEPSVSPSLLVPPDKLPEARAAIHLSVSVARWAASISSGVPVVRVRPLSRVPTRLPDCHFDSMHSSDPLRRRGARSPKFCVLSRILARKIRCQRTAKTFGMGMQSDRIAGLDQCRNKNFQLAKK